MTPEEDESLRTLGRALEVLAGVDGWESRTGTLSGGWKATDGSELAEDDISAHPYGVSPAAWAAITASVSHLACLRDSLFHTVGPNEIRAKIHTHGQLTLVRGALENASMAVWLLEDDDSSERILRRLQVDREERRELDATRKAVREGRDRDSSVADAPGDDMPASKTMDEHLQELSAIAERTGADPGELKKRPGYGDIVKAASKHLKDDDNLAFIVWKACSSIAHGELRGAAAYLSNDALGSPAPGMELRRVSGNLLLLERGGLMAIGTARKAFDLFDRRASTPSVNAAGPHVVPSAQRS